MAAMTPTQPSTVPMKCTSCERPMESPVCCQSCHTLHPADASLDYFQLFGLPRRYAVDPADLHRRFLSISRNIHPDFFGGEAEEMRNLALRLSAQVNEAYETLNDPVSRAEYLLESAGGKSSAQDKSVPGNLLAEVMTLREEIEEAKATGNRESLILLRAQLESRRLRLEETIADLCDRLDTPSEEVRAELRRQLNAMRYLNNVLAELS